MFYLFYYIIIVIIITIVISLDEYAIYELCDVINPMPIHTHTEWCITGPVLFNNTLTVTSYWTDNVTTERKSFIITIVGSVDIFSLLCRRMMALLCTISCYQGLRIIALLALLNSSSPLAVCCCSCSQMCSKYGSFFLQWNL